jgi:hypothetical protein
MLQPVCTQVVLLVLLGLEVLELPDSLLELQLPSRQFSI